MPDRHRPAPPRIGTGSMAGRKLLGPPGKGTRPMTGLAKKSLFGQLAGWLDGAVVLDLYAGTGTLGLESFSNGARKVAFAEQARAVVERLQRNLDDCGVADRSLVWQGNLEARLADWLIQLGEPFDVAFVDPPYPAARKWNWDRTAEKLFAPLAGAIANDGVIVLRLPGDMNVPDRLGSLELVRRREYGAGMAVGFFQLPGAE